MQPTNFSAASTHAILHSGPSPTPGSTFRCIGVRRVAGKTFFNLQTAKGDLVATVEFIAGCVPVKGGTFYCTRRSGTYIALNVEHAAPFAAQATSKTDQVLALCSSLGYLDI
ncbi:unnamed protein product [Peniophora sp. CBMAI 1063]|nr:unnamed protein product [Peniophora sp. CBMAI 1063]